MHNLQAVYYAVVLYLLPIGHRSEVCAVWICVGGAATFEAASTGAKVCTQMKKGRTVLAA